MSPLRTRKRRATTLLPLALVASVLLSGAAAQASTSSAQKYPAKDQNLTVKPRIVGGAPITIDQAPWQVYLRALDPATGSYFACGGSILDATTILTAGHCLFDEATGAPLPVNQFQVFAGVSAYDPTTGDATGGQQSALTSATPHPYYVEPPGAQGTTDQFADDAAVLKLATPLTFNASVQPIALGAENNLVPFGSGATVTGYGRQDPADTAPPTGGLFALGENVQDPTPIGALNALFTVGLTPAGSFCSGDSGGLTAGGVVIGVVSATGGCNSGTPNFYTNVTAGEIQEFIKGNLAPPLAPRGGTDVVLAAPDATPSKGDVLNCSPGTWQNSPAYTYTFTDTKTNTVLQTGGSQAYTVTGTTDAGATISCRVSASNPGGVGLTPPTQSTPAVQAAPKPKPKPKPQPKAHYRVSVSLNDGKSSIRRGQKLTYTVTSRNRGNRRMKSVRQCVKLSSRFTLVSRHGGKVSGGSICWSTGSLRTGHKRVNRVTVRIDRDARLGRLSTKATVAAKPRGKDSASSSVRVLRAARRAPTPPPGGGVTG